MTSPTPAKSATLKARAVEELKDFWAIALYLWVFLGSFTIYRRLVVAESGGVYLHYGIALIEALVVAKVILIGKMTPFSRRFEDRALIVSVLYKSCLFGVFMLLFGFAERLVDGWIHDEGPLGGLRNVRELGARELAARALVLLIAFVPLFSFWEIGRLLGKERLTAMFFSRPDAPETPRERAD